MTSGSAFHLARVWAALLLALAVALSPVVATPASAQVEWCDGDPPITVFINGRPVVVNVHVLVPKPDMALAPLAQIRGRVDGEKIIITVIGPPTQFKLWADVPALGRITGDLTKVFERGSKQELKFEKVTRERSSESGDDDDGQDEDDD
ncbi:MAG TPA: hypothetical protein VFN74_23085 [Chloroflexota bacterium]|nr:hypothetical protein [Chloroflexota bacterium]